MHRLAFALALLAGFSVESFVCAQGAGDVNKVLAASGLREGYRANVLIVGPLSFEAALEAAKLKDVRVYLLSSKDRLQDVCRRVDDAKAYGSVIVRQGAPEDTTFPDYFFHKLVVLPGMKEIEKYKEELGRVTRPGGVLLLGGGLGNTKFFENEKRRDLAVGTTKWVEVTRPVIGSEWPMMGGTFYGNTLTRMYYSSDDVIKPPMKTLWKTSLENLMFGEPIVSGGVVYGNRGFALDAYTGEVLKQVPSADSIGAVRGGIIFANREDGVVAIDQYDFNKKWSARGLSALGVKDGKLVCQKRDKEVVYLDPATGGVVDGPVIEKGLERLTHYALAPDGTIWQKRTDTGGIHRKKGEKDEKWVAPKMHLACSNPVIANGYLWWLNPLAVVRIPMQWDEVVGDRNVYFHSGPVSCYAPAIAYGKIYLRTQWAKGQDVICLTSGRPYPEQLAADKEPVTERSGEPAVAGAVNYGPEDWPMYHYDLARTGASPDTKMSSAPEILWKFETGGKVRSSPSVVGDRVYVGSTDGKFYALDANTGQKIWTYFTADEIHSSPCVWSGMVYFGSDDGFIYCLNASSGKLIWRRESDRPRKERSLSAQGGSSVDYLHDKGKSVDICLGRLCIDGAPKLGPHAVRSEPFVVNGKLYVGTGLGYLYCLDAKSGELLWKRRVRPFDYAPAYAGGKVYILNACLTEVDAETGDFKGPAQVKYDSHLSSLVLAKDRAFVTASHWWGGAQYGFVFCISLVDGGSIIGEGQPCPVDNIRRCPAIVGDKIYFAGGGEGERIDVYPASGDYWGIKKGFSAFPPMPRLSSLETGGMTASPAYGNGCLFCPVRRDLLVVDASTMKKVGRARLGGDIYSSPAVSRGRLYVGCDDGRVYCLGSK